MIDTGFYLACSELNRRQAGRATSISLLHGLATQLQATMLTSSSVLLEAAQHTSSFLASQPTSWHREQTAHFFERFFRLAAPYDLTPADVLAAVENLRRCREEPPAKPKRRSAPTLADALTAEVVHRSGAAVLISDDSKDFGMLLPDYNFEQISVTQALRMVRQS